MTTNRVAALIVDVLLLPLRLYVRRGTKGEARIVRFQLCSEFLSQIPFQFGILARRRFYERELQSCGTNLVARLGAMVIYPESTIGNNVLLARDVSVGLASIGDGVLISHRVSLLSGRHHHRGTDVTIPLGDREDRIDRIVVGNGAWIGADATIMANVGQGAIVGAASVVVHDIPEFAVAVGNPARIVRQPQAETTNAAWAIEHMNNETSTVSGERR